jgi:DNA replication protein DnaD
MSQVKLMNRSDHKFWFSYELLHDMLRCIKNDYYILSINNQVLLPYKTTYYDTLKNDMYVAHHNGKLNRYKIRRRSYIINDISFLEVKFKNNKGRTIKNRIQTNTSNHHFSKKEAEFIREYSPFTCEELTPSLQNKFNRITLVAKNFNERCTIDTNLLFELSESKVDLNNLVVLEIKSDGRLDKRILCRYKIRRRSYIINDISFLEVKFKNNKGRTIKNRIQTNTSNHHFSKKEAEFIREYSPFTCEELTPSLQNKFNRITLVAKNFNERCTIDTNLLFELSESKVDLNNLVVLEIKSDGRLDNSPFENTLKDYRIRSSGFSKYCIGRTIIDPYVKKNAFKKKLRSIEKVLHA